MNENQLIAEIARSSGPAAALLVILALLIKAWFVELKAQLGSLQERLESYRDKASTLEVTLTRHEGQLANIEHRVDKLEGAK
jgi:Tfp pilus assembly protein PilO